MIKFLAMLSLISLISCTSTKELQEQRRKSLDSWKGHSKSELILSWGPPTKTDSDGDTGQVLTWAKYQTVYIINRANPVWTYTMMYVGADGIIYHWREEKSPNAR